MYFTFQIKFHKVSNMKLVHNLYCGSFSKKLFVVKRNKIGRRVKSLFSLLTKNQNIKQTTPEKKTVIKSDILYKFKINIKQ